MVEMRFQGFGGIRLSCDAFGSADDPAVVLLPPSGQDGLFWRQSARALAEAGRHAICINPRGHGGSDFAADGRYDLDAYVEDLRAILVALPNRAFVVGAGLGGLVAIAAIGEGPNLASGLALVDVSIWFDEADVARMHSALLKRTTGAGDTTDIVRSFDTAHPGEPKAEVGERLLSAFDRDASGRLAWRGDARALSGADLAAEQDRLGGAAARIAVPTTIVRGTENSTISGDVARQLQKLIRGAELAEIEGAGHIASFEGADSFNAILLEFIERSAPRQALSYRGGSEPRILRDALGCFGTGVTVVTTVDEAGKPVGLTANSFTSVSLDPPLVLFSLARSSYNLATFEKAGRFAINVLHIGQQPVANRFIQRDIERFDGVDWSYRVEGGSPILHGSLASFDCRTYAVNDGGDHLIFVGEVTHAWFEPHRDPLLYFRGRYRRLHFQ